MSAAGIRGDGEKAGRTGDCVRVSEGNTSIQYSRYIDISTLSRGAKGEVHCRECFRGV